MLNPPTPGAARRFAPPPTNRLDPPPTPPMLNVVEERNIRMTLDRSCDRLMEITSRLVALKHVIHGTGMPPTNPAGANGEVHDPALPAVLHSANHIELRVSEIMTLLSDIEGGL
jgi:hypothetical protein